MTNEEMRVAIAIDQGWTDVRVKTVMRGQAGVRGLVCKTGLWGTSPTRELEIVPIWPIDLNDMHLIEKTLTLDQMESYADILGRIASGSEIEWANPQRVFSYMHATAAQRA